MPDEKTDTWSHRIGETKDSICANACQWECVSLSGCGQRKVHLVCVSQKALLYSSSGIGDGSDSSIGILISEPCQHKRRFPLLRHSFELISRVSVCDVVSAEADLEAVGICLFLKFSKKNHQRECV